MKDKAGGGGGGLRDGKRGGGPGGDNPSSSLSVKGESGCSGDRQRPDHREATP